MKKFFYLVTLVVISLSIFTACEPSIGKDGVGKHKGHEYVDLGLSVKWATCNVGAESPEEYGDYFAWGEVESKTTYDWSTYKYGSDYNQLTKYCNDSDLGYNGFTDNKTVLDPEDDAATVNWGGKWRMPTVEEQEELKDNCTWTLTTKQGIKGYKLTSKIDGYTDCSIFLPIAGYMGRTGLYDTKCGYYWGSSLYVYGGASFWAGSLGLLSDGRIWSHCFLDRYMGYLVRPVLP